MKHREDRSEDFAEPGVPGEGVPGEGSIREGEDLEAGAPEDCEQDLDDLLLLFQSGDREAFDRIVGRFEAPLWRFFYRLCWDRERAEDFVQDVFLRVYRSAQRYQPRGRLSTFLYRIATNRWIDHWRSMRPRPTLFSLDSADGEDESPIRDRIASAAVSPSESLEQDGEKERLRVALETLSMPHRLVFELAVYQNLPYPQISDLLGIPVGTVKSRMHNTTKALRQILDPDAAHDAGPSRGPRSRRA